MREVGRLSDDQGERKAERLDEGAETKTREGDISYSQRMLFGEKLNLVIKKLKKRKRVNNAWW